jgi:hypothetical protein
MAAVWVDQDLTHAAVFGKQIEQERQFLRFVRKGAARAHLLVPGEPQPQMKSSTPASNMERRIE